MKPLFISFLMVFVFVSCATQEPAATFTKSKIGKGNHPQILVNSYAFLVEQITPDATYGLKPENAIKVGGSSDGEGTHNERRFLNALAGPNGEEVDYYRVESCCPQPSVKAALGSAILDKYAVFYKGSKDTLLLYINRYDSEKLFIPKGFTTRNFPN